jgi:cell wall-associated NlpC family hydrolase
VTGEDVATAALALVGTPFRLHGRDPRSGLDCVGVLAAALGGETALPNGYTLRSRTLPDVPAIMATLGLAEARGDTRPGDILMLRCPPCQFHFAIAAAATRIVHAHAGLRKVVLGPLPEAWPVIGCWRLPSPSPLARI